MRVDGHVHLWDERQIAGSPPYPLPIPLADADSLLPAMATGGIDAAVLVQPTVHGGDYRCLMQAMADHPGRFAGVGLIDRSLADAAAQCRRIEEAADLGLAGIRAHPIDHPGLDIEAIARAAQRHGLSLELHVDPSSWDAVFRALDSADIEVVVDHFGRPQDPRSDEALAFVRRLGAYPNATVKVAAVELIWGQDFPYRNFRYWVAIALAELGPARLMWGSNYPWSRDQQYGASITQIDTTWGLSETEMGWLFGGTAERVYSLTTGGPR